MGGFGKLEFRRGYLVEWWAESAGGLTTLRTWIPRRALSFRRAGRRG